MKTTLYISVLKNFDTSFFAIDHNGTEKWQFDAGHYVDSSLQYHLMGQSILGLIMEILMPFVQMVLPDG